MMSIYSKKSCKIITYQKAPSLLADINFLISDYHYLVKTITIHMLKMQNGNPTHL